MPALVVTDVRMPGEVTALTLCRFFRSMAVPVIVLTGLPRKDNDIDEILHAGCGPLLIKPVPPDMLCAEVRRALTAPHQAS
jgi:CheY-like chemotaxis protein